MKKNFRKYTSVVLASSMLLSMGMTGCSKNDNQPATTPAATETIATETPVEEIVLKLPVYNPTALEIYKKLDLPGEYKKIKPNVTIEMEVIKEKEYENTMRIRNSANELPDILKLQGKWLYDFNDSMVDISDLDAVKNNMFAADYAIDGKIIGIPESQNGEVIWYRKSVFKELGIEIPKTWPQFMEALTKIKEDGKYIPLAMGGKDGWPDYPFNEFMPQLVSQNGNLWNDMATQDEPFSKDQPFAKAYEKIQQLYDAKVMGPDPLGITWDQAGALLFSKKAAMMAAGQWFGSDVSTKADDPSDVGAFLMPVRDTESEPFATISLVDGFWGIPKTCKHIDEVKEFYNWFFTTDWYTKLMTEQQAGATMKDVKIEFNAPFDTLYNVDNLKYVAYKDGMGDFVEIQNAIKFDVKKIGQEMMAENNLDKTLEKLNKDWKDAKANLK